MRDIKVKGLDIWEDKWKIKIQNLVWKKVACLWRENSYDLIYSWKKVSSCQWFGEKTSWRVNIKAQGLRKIEQQFNIFSKLKMGEIKKFLKELQLTR